MPDAGSPSPHDPLAKGRELLAVADDILRMQSMDKVRGTHQEKMEALNFLRRLGILKEVKK